MLNLAYARVRDLGSLIYQVSSQQIYPEPLSSAERDEGRKKNNHQKTTTNNKQQQKTTKNNTKNKWINVEIRVYFLLLVVIFCLL